MSVLAKVIEERAQWAERNREIEIRRKRFVEFLKKIFVITIMGGVIYYHKQLFEALQALLINMK